MLKTYLYIPDNLAKKIDFAVRELKKSKAEVLRSAIEEGIEVMERKNTGGAEVLLKIAEIAERNNVRGPRDASINHDYYLYGLPKKNPRIKP